MTAPDVSFAGAQPTAPTGTGHRTGPTTPMHHRTQMHRGHTEHHPPPAGCLRERSWSPPRDLQSIFAIAERVRTC